MTQTDQPKRIYVCGNIHCASRGADAVYQQLDREMWRHNLDGAIELQLGGCQDHCDYGPNMIVWPGPCRYAQLTPTAATAIVVQHLVGGEPVADYLATPEMRRSPR